MTSPISSLRTAIRSILQNDDQLINRLGGPQIFVVAPAGETPPYVTFGDAKVDDWSAAGMIGHHHRLSLDIWTREGGDEEALVIANRIAEILPASNILLEGHTLVELLVISQIIDPLSGAGITHAQVLIEAYTEILN